MGLSKDTLISISSIILTLQALLLCVASQTVFCDEGTTSQRGDCHYFSEKTLFCATGATS